MGKTYLPPGFDAELAIPSLHSSTRELTSRQREVLQLLAEGRSGKEIAETLCVSTRTVEFHKYNIMRQLGLHSTAELTQYAIKHGIITP
jgi:DNA-binding NarL/FixJ family response regulator